jgi:hypothetical protein
MPAYEWARRLTSVQSERPSPSSATMRHLERSRSYAAVPSDENLCIVGETGPQVGTAASGFVRTGPAPCDLQGHQSCQHDSGIELPDQFF